MMKTFDLLMEKDHDEKVVAMVAETDFQYGADTFEAYEKVKIVSETVIQCKAFELKKNGKSR